MSGPSKPPYYERDDAGRVRMKITRGSGAGSASGAFAQFFAKDGTRLTRTGAPVPARAHAAATPTVWDLPDVDAAPARPPKAPDLAPALARLSRAPTFRAALADVQGAGWSISIAPTVRRSCCRRGPNILAVDGNAGASLLAGLAHGVALAHASTQPLPLERPEDAAFIHDNTVRILLRDAEARLEAAIVRDELIAAGSGDIGGPGLRGTQLGAYLGFVEGGRSRASTIAAIAASTDGPEGRTFQIGRGPLAADLLARAFAPRPPGVGLALPQDIVDVVQRLDALDTLDPERVGRALVLQLRPDPHEDNPFIATLRADAAGRTLPAVRLRLPSGRVGAPSLLLACDDPSADAEALRQWFGPGTPFDLDTWGGEPHATVAYRLQTYMLYLTYRVEDGAVASLAFEGLVPG